jgi:lipoprotein-anchoring transpeptidase ErfK/SrfK
MKQILKATKPFWRDEANVPKLLTIKDVPNEMRTRRKASPKPSNNKAKQGDDKMLNLNAFIATSRRAVAFGALAIGSFAFSGSALAAPPSQLFPPPFFLVPQTQMAPPPTVEAAPQDDERSTFELPARLRRQVVNYATREAPGTIIIDTPNTYLYLVLGGGQAMRYGIGVGRDGFTWSGVQSISKKAEWPDWVPPPEMIARQPYLPRHMAGGPGNPLGARAMYLGGTVYRIHGTNAPETIGTHVSSGCIRLSNADVTDLYSRVNVGTKVIVLPMTDRRADLGAAVR